VTGPKNIRKPAARGRVPAGGRTARNAADEKVKKRAEKPGGNRSEREALRPSGGLYKSVFTYVSEGFALHEIITDVKGRPVDYRFLDVNPAFERLTGLKGSDIIGKRVLEVLPGVEDHWIETYGRVALTGEPARFENLSGPLGRWYNVFAFSPAPRRFAVIFVDVTEPREEREALKEALEKLRFAQKSAAAGVWDWDMVTGRLTWSRELYLLFGLDPESQEATFDRWRRVMHPDDRPAAEQRIDAAIRNRVPLSNEYRIILPSGEERWISALGDTVYDDSGRALRMAGICLDVTERRRAEDALRDAEERLQAQTERLQAANEELQMQAEELRQQTEELQAASEEVNIQAEELRNAYDQLNARDMLLAESEARMRRAEEIAHLGSWEYDLLAGRLTWSDEVYRVFGLDPGRHAPTYEAFLAAVHPGDREAVHNAYMGSVAAGGAGYEIEHRILRGPSGEVRIVREKCVHFRDRAGAVVRSVGMVHDITEQKLAQEELIKLNRTLRALSDSNQALMRASDERRFLDESCRIITETCGYAMTWIGFAENDKPKSVRPAAWAGFEKGYLETLGLTWADRARGRGPTGTAIRTGSACICRNMLTDPKFRPWREEALKRGYASSIALPLAEGGRALGALTIYSKYPDPFSESEVRLLTELAGDIAYGVTTLRLRAAHARAEEALRASHEGLEVKVRERTAELKSEKDRLQTLIDSLADEVWVCDAAGKLVLANRAAMSIVGRPDWSVAGDNPSSPDYAAAMERAGTAKKPVIEASLRRSLAGETLRDIEVAITQGGTGTRLVRQVTSSPMRDESGRITGAVAVVRDVTERIRLEEEIRKREEHLRRVQRMEALGTLAGGIAHDFNNVLATIVINTELALLDADERGRACNNLSLVLKAATRGRDLARQIITFSRRSEQNLKPVKISPLVREALKFLRSSLPANIEIRESLDAASDVVRSDPSQIHQILMNFCTNAAHAMRQKGGILSVELTSLDVDQAAAVDFPGLTPGPFLRLRVSDTGHGMTPEILERVFDPFFTTKGPGEGSGMGLSVVHSIVKACGGAVFAASEAGSGSSFAVFLPRLTVEVKPEKAAEETSLGSGERILLVEDEDTQRESLVRMLERLGYGVTDLSDGAAALEEFRRDPQAYDLVITDQSMPKMSGSELAEAVLAERNDLPVILCTGFSDAVDGKIARAKGVREFVVKPFTLAEISKTIRRALAGTGAGAGKKSRGRKPEQA